MSPNGDPKFGNLIWLQLIFGQKPCFWALIQLARRKVNIHYYIVKSLHHGPYVSFKSCLLLAYFTIWHMAWKTKCVQTLFTLEDRLPKNPWIHLILNWKKSKLQLPAKKQKWKEERKEVAKKRETLFLSTSKRKENQY